MKLTKIKKLYYKVIKDGDNFNFNQTKYLTNPPLQSAIVILKLTDCNFNYIDNTFLSWKNDFIPPNNKELSEIDFKESYNKLIIIDNDGSTIHAEFLQLDKEQEYIDEVININTELIWIVIHGTCKYKNAKKIKMKMFDPNNEYPFYTRKLIIYG